MENRNRSWQNGKINQIQYACTSISLEKKLSQVMQKNLLFFLWMVAFKTCLDLLGKWHIMPSNKVWLRSYKKEYAALLALHLLLLLNPWLIAEMRPAFLYIGITLLNVHQKWLNWFHFLYLKGGLLVILIDCIIFLSPLLDVTRMSVPPRADRLWNYLPIECFPLTSTIYPSNFHIWQMTQKIQSS